MKTHQTATSKKNPIQDQFDWNYSLKDFLTSPKYHPMPQPSQGDWYCNECEPTREDDVHCGNYNPEDYKKIDFRFQVKKSEYRGDKPHWEFGYHEHIIDCLFMAYGFGCWDRCATFLERYGLSVSEIHRYVHTYTHLASFHGLIGLHVSMRDLAMLVTLELRDGRKHAPDIFTEPRSKWLFVPPQLVYHVQYSDDELDHGVAASRLRQYYFNRLSLTQDEVILARQFFSRDSVQYDFNYDVRKERSYEEFRKKDLVYFIKYEYPSKRRRGTFPLDVNDDGLLFHPAGRNTGYDSDISDSSEDYCVQKDWKQKPAKDVKRQLAQYDRLMFLEYQQNKRPRTESRASLVSSDPSNQPGSHNGGTVVPALPNDAILGCLDHLLQELGRVNQLLHADSVQPQASTQAAAQRQSHLVSSLSAGRIDSVAQVKHPMARKPKSDATQVPLNAQSPAASDSRSSRKKKSAEADQRSQKHFGSLVCDRHTAENK